MGGCRALLSASLLVLPAYALAQAPVQDQELLARGYRTRALAWSVGHSWPFGWNDASRATTDLLFIGFHPQLGWFPGGDAIKLPIELKK